MARDEAVDVLKALYSGLAAQMEPGAGTPPGRRRACVLIMPSPPAAISDTIP